VLGEAIWLGGSYLQNEPLAFHLGLLFNVGFLLLIKRWFRPPTIAIQVMNTIIVFSIGLPVADFFLRSSRRLDDPLEMRKRYFSYDTARKYPMGFSRWWRYYNEQWDKLKEQVATRDPSGAMPYRLRPGSAGDFFRSHITINSNGFRGKEILAEKGDTYRIVAIGESTTFGVTMNAEDKPWPEVLEEMIRTRLKLARPVEVINAGIPAHTLKHTLLRLESEILPLKPDMIICYHGYNGLYLLNESLPYVAGPSPPKYQPRPLKILADGEQSLKLTRYKNALVVAAREKPPRALDPMTSPYADAYRQLIQATQTNHIRLAIATFSMAVNSRSDDAVTEFYRTVFPAVRGQIQANVLHANMIRQLVNENPDLDLVDTQPSLDGYHDKFIDLMHLTQEGRQEVAEAFFAGIKKTLQECLTPSPHDQPQ
jgi:lysophospholipase L1-like esterase